MADPMLSDADIDRMRTPLWEQARAAYEAGRTEDVAPLEAFLSKHLRSAWTAALLTNLGTVYRRTGYFSKAHAAWEHA